MSKMSNKGIRTIIYPVTDLARARAMFQQLMGIEPYADAPYYVGFRLEDQEIGLDPNSHKAGMTAYYKVEDLKQSLQALLDAGAKTLQEPTDVGGGKLIASVRDDDGNIIGLTQEP